MEGIARNSSHILLVSVQFKLCVLLEYFLHSALVFLHLLVHGVQPHLQSHVHTLKFACEHTPQGVSV